MNEEYFKFKTTTIGAFPKPTYLKIPDWFQKEIIENPNSLIVKYETYMSRITNEDKEKINQAIKNVINLQNALGIDFQADGEIKRENYIHYHLRYLEGISFKKLIEKSIRDGNLTLKVPIIVSKLQGNKHFLAQDWKEAQQYSNFKVKSTIPGPLTIYDSIYDKFYNNKRKCCEDIASCLNYEILDLVENGQTVIQIDEPLFARQPDDALQFGIDNIEKCFKGVNDNVFKIVHMCCGYPNYLDQENYQKADSSSYLKIAKQIDNNPYIDAISIEDAHQNNPLELFKYFKRIKVILGVIDIASSKIESIEQIKQRIIQICSVFPKERLIIAPDCGLGYLNDEIILNTKLQNMIQAKKEAEQFLNQQKN